MLTFQVDEGIIEVNFDSNTVYFQYQDYEATLECHGPSNICWCFEDMWRRRYKIEKQNDKWILRKLDWKFVATAIEAVGG